MPPASFSQFEPSAILRELNKADVRLKFCVLLMAASENVRDLAYFTFHNPQLRDDLFRIHTFLVQNDVTLEDLAPLQLFPFLYSHRWP
ncbi:unnamed protein product, partial [Darwinula stevensoni]